MTRRGVVGRPANDPINWDAAVWIVNSMWETGELPGGLTHDEVHRIERAAGTVEPLIVGNVNLDESLLKDATVTGGGLGGSRSPGEGWRRLRWSELSERIGVDQFRPDVPPSHLSFPVRSWPVSIQPPSEGSLDYEQFTRLFEQLAAVSVDGAETECWCFYAPAASHDWDHPTVYRCVLRLLAALYEDEEDGSPSNIWPVDRSWFVYTDADLWGTKISGSHELISCLVADDELETVELGF